jgi:hypothetical protein
MPIQAHISNKITDRRKINPLSTSVRLKTIHNFQGWSPQQQEVQHLQGCRKGRATFLPETSHGDFLDTGSANNAKTLGNNHWTNVPMMNEVIHPKSGKEIQYKDIMKHPTLSPQYKTGFGNELGRLCQGIREIQGKNTCFFVELTNIPKYRKITYGKLVCD